MAERLTRDEGDQFEQWITDPERLHRWHTRHTTDEEKMRAAYEFGRSLRSEEDGRDAERYRWLRDISVPPHNFYLSVPDEFKGVRYSPAEVDAAIDAALAALAKARGE